MILNEGSRAFLEYYLNNNDCYLGLWSSSGEITSTNFSLTEFAQYELSGLKEYSRVLIPKGTWILIDSTSSIYSLKTCTFSPIYQSWSSIYGYFLSSTSDNSGILLAVYRFADVTTITKGTSLPITPYIRMTS